MFSKYHMNIVDSSTCVMVLYLCVNEVGLVQKIMVRFLTSLTYHSKVKDVINDYDTVKEISNNNDIG